MTETLLPEIVMDDVQIDEAVRFINDRIIAIVYNGSLEILGYVLENFFNNDIHLAGSRNGNKLVSYRELCAHPDMTVPRTTLMEMVRAAAQRNFLMDKGIPAGALKYSHLIVLNRLKNDEEKTFPCPGAH